VTTDRTVRLKKVPSPAASHQSVTATYAVLVDGKTEGHVDKYEERTMTHSGSRGGRRQRHRTDTYWGWRRPGVREDATGYDRRRDAVDRLVKSLKAVS
jgi:hypothetical protein